MSSWSNLNFQDSNSPLMEQLILFHDHAMIILILITISVTYIIILMMFNKWTNRFLLNSQMIEVIWTVIPSIMLIFIAFPSLQLLYMLDEMSNPAITIKTMGNQWFWSYEYSDFYAIEFDSYMINSTNNNNDSNFRLLDVDNRVILPMNTKTQMLISSSDVIHSWTIPSLGVKVDGVPGRLNQINFSLNRPGLYFGQCSEICGANHSFMPIVIESINLNNFINWMKNN